jgi:hypothetical protein
MFHVKATSFSLSHYESFARQRFQVTLIGIEPGKRAILLAGHGNSCQSYTMFLFVKYRGGTMGNLNNALEQLRAERKQAQVRVESIDQAISVIESLNGSGKVSQANQPARIISQASRRKMAEAQRARWARAKKAPQPVVAIAKTKGSAPVKHTMSAAARRKIAAFQRARWAKIKAQQKKAA